MMKGGLKWSVPSALLVTLSALACLSLNTVWHDEANGAISAVVVAPPCISGVAQPAPAAAAGYNCLKIYETWPSLASVDTTDSRAPGFKWYTHNGSTQTPPGVTNAGGWSLGQILPTPSGDYTWSTPGQLSIQPVSTTPYAGLPIQLMSCAQQGTSQNLVGTVFGPGAYMDIEVKQFGQWTNSIWGIAWGVSEVMMNGGIGALWKLFEPDIFEAFTPSPGLNFAYHDWSGNGATVNYNNSFGTPFFTPVDGDTVGMLILPSAYNGGTNKVERYVNDTLVPHSTCTSTGTNLATCDGSTSTITLTPINDNRYCLALGGGVQQATIFGKIQVWTKS